VKSRVADYSLEKAVKVFLDKHGSVYYRHNDFENQTEIVVRIHNSFGAIWVNETRSADKIGAFCAAVTLADTV
jgi:hypothetical protein